MIDRYARAVYHESETGGIVVVRSGNGDYFELSALDRFHAEQKLTEFARLNRLILSEVAGFHSQPVSAAIKSEAVNDVSSARRRRYVARGAA